MRDYKPAIYSFILGIFFGTLMVRLLFGLTENVTQDLPTHVILNDWTNGKSVSYVAYPEIEDDILVLNEATITFVEDLEEPK